MYGFSLIKQENITEINATARLWKHDRTGARFVSLCCDDENKVFGVSFRTPPKDSTGIAHILEHSVLCGSKKYPVKEPFVELLKSSLQTFLNAFTYPDKTCYPVASTNLQDFYNLVDVYLDAVFHPLIPLAVFQQEGWHYELDKREGPLTRKGVVYNEMKGAYSSPDSLLMEYSQRELFPDNAYGLDSGGDPKIIPTLTYKQFKDFHHNFYHPSNAYFWFYGDDKEEKRLELLGAVLADYGRLKPDSDVLLQPSFSVPKAVEYPYAASTDAKAMFTINWLLPETTDRERVLSLIILEEILIGLHASPLRRALTESGLGEDLAGVGLETELRQMYFSIGLKGITKENIKKAKNIIFSVLTEVRQQGIADILVEAAINSVEFALREGNTGRFPKGLAMMVTALTTWLYDGDPFAPLRFEAPLTALKKRLLTGEKVFEELIQTYFLENTHQVQVTLVPDKSLDSKQKEQEEKELAARLAQMDNAERHAVMAKTKELLIIQEQADSPEALASIPQLALKDIEKTNKIVPVRAGEEATLVHELPTQGIVYMDIGFDISAVSVDLLPLVPLLGRALFETGTDKEDFASLSMRIARKTGGMGAETFISASLIEEKPVARMFLRGKSTAENAEEMLTLFQEVLKGAKITDKERFKTILTEEKARLEQQLVPSGHLAVLSALRSGFSQSGYAAECMGGVHALLALRELMQRVKDDWDSVARDMETLRNLVITKNRILFNLTAEGKHCVEVEKLLPAFVSSLPETKPGPAGWTPPQPAKARGFSLPSQVNYVGKMVDLRQAGYTFHGAHLAAVKYARMGYLWEHIRVRGGAYGAFCLLDRLAGTMAFVSYRDPALTKTLQTFDGIGDYFSTLDLPDKELEKSIIGAIGDVDTYLLPDAQGFTSMLRHITGDTDALRATIRDELLHATTTDFHNLGETIKPLLPTGHIAVLGKEEDMEQAEVNFDITRIL